MAVLPQVGPPPVSTIIAANPGWNLIAQLTTTATGFQSHVIIAWNIEVAAQTGVCAAYPILAEALPTSFAYQNPAGRIFIPGGPDFSTMADLVAYWKGGGT